MSKTDTLVYAIIVTSVMTLGFLASNACAAQDEPDPVRLRITYGSLPSLVSGTDHAVIQPTETLHDAKYVGSNIDGTFRHYYLEGGVGCLFTGNPDGAGGVKDVGGGRSCTVVGESCAYISEGYHVYALSGETCSAYGVGECQGPFCR